MQCNKKAYSVSENFFFVLSDFAVTMTALCNVVYPIPSQ